MASNDAEDVTIPEEGEKDLQVNKKVYPLIACVFPDISW